MSMALLLIQGHMPPVGSATAFCNALSCRHDGIRRGHWQHEPNPLHVLCSPPPLIVLPLQQGREMQRRQSSWKAPALCRNRRQSICHRQRSLDWTWIGVPNSIGHVVRPVTTMRNKTCPVAGALCDASLHCRNIYGSIIMAWLE